MELEDFIAETLKQIIKGIQKSQKSEGGGLINQRFRSNPANPGLINAFENGLISIVDFDVLVSAEASGKIKGGIRVFSIGAEGDGQISKASANRIKFSVPIRLPDGAEVVERNTRERTVIDDGY